MMEGPLGSRVLPPPPSSSSAPAAPTLGPAVPPSVKLGLTVAYTAFYGALFLFVYAQLWLVLRLRHKRLSFQTAFLFLCLLWAALRALLFSFYFRDAAGAPRLLLGPFAFWLLYCCPVCLQFLTLALLNLYFAQVIFKAKSKYSPELLKYRLPLYLVSFFVSLLFLLVNLTCAVLVRIENSESKIIVLVRVAINDTLFVLCAISLSICLYKISKMSLANIYLESKGSSVCQLTTIGVAVILLYTSRACYNLVILSFYQSKAVNSFDYDWYNVSDQADLKCQLGDAGYVVFGVVLFVWELLPTSLVVFFFRVRNPTKDLTNPGIVPSRAFNPRSYFFDNPRRYDSDDDLAWSISPHSIHGSFSPDYYDWGHQSNSFMAHVGSLQHDRISETERPSPV